MGEVNLGSAMRANLLSLQHIQQNMDATQLRLATGLRINSAMDNPTSYYTAQSLNNRAQDLSALLDGMGQAIQTIQTANEGLEAGAKLLEYAKVVATNAQQTSWPTQSLEWYQSKAALLGGVVVTSAEELKAATDGVNDAGLVVVYGNITMDANDTIALNAGQKLVGANYFSNDGVESTINFNSSVRDFVGIKLADNVTVSDLTVNLNSTSGSSSFAIAALSKPDVDDFTVGIELHNLNIKATGNNSTGLLGLNGKMVLSGINNISSNGNASNCGARFLGGTVDIKGDFTASSDTGRALDVVFLYDIGIDIDGTARIYQPNANLNAEDYISVKSGSKALVNVKSITDSSKLDWESGAYLGVQSSSGTKWFVSTSAGTGSYADIGGNGWTETTAPDLTPTVTDTIPTDIQNYQNSYETIIDQYDALIASAHYNGINLLKADSLNVAFSEDGTSSLEVKGVDAGSASLGLASEIWRNKSAIAMSVEKIERAIETLRGYSGEFGNYYSILQTQQSFTENIINILTVGADDLTLADMNEESANMLSLQTQQALAINSLSLAAQATQSVLKLF